MKCKECAENPPARYRQNAMANAKATLVGQEISEEAIFCSTIKPDQPRYYYLFYAET